MAGAKGESMYTLEEAKEATEVQIIVRILSFIPSEMEQFQGSKQRNVFI